MAKKSAVQAGPMVWTVAELGAFYTEHRSELLSHANRVLKDSTKAEEITQEALIKFMLAAPELESTEHGLSYLHRTIENLCIDLFRRSGGIGRFFSRCPAWRPGSFSSPDRRNQQKGEHQGTSGAHHGGIGHPFSRSHSEHANCPLQTFWRRAY